ncbi:hypothetical protein AX15_006974, partial [Amanita polypyramis BW_CC]
MAAELEDLSEGLEADEQAMAAETGHDAEEGTDDIEGLVDLVAEMDSTERTAHEERICPVRLVLVKLRKLAFKIINSTTILLPAWHKAVENAELRPRNMPRDVRTRWNSTYDMLCFTLKYKQAVKSMTETRELDLRGLELSPKEWMLAQQLADVLK